MSVRGYKAMNPDMTCRGFKFEVGKTYEMDGEPVPCRYGFHFCENVCDVFDYYDRFECILFEVEAIGEVATDGIKSCTNRIRIVRRLSTLEESRASYGYGYGDGYGHGHGHGHGHGYDYGHGHGHGDDYGHGDGHGYGHGDGYGYGHGYGDGYGHGHGYGYGINKVFVWED